MRGLVDSRLGDVGRFRQPRIRRVDICPPCTTPGGALVSTESTAEESRAHGRTCANRKVNRQYALPSPDDETFHKRADLVLTGMRKLRTALPEAARRRRSSPMVIVALSDVRQSYDDLMGRAAGAAGSSLGQQLYAARIHAKLSAQEAANGAGLRAELLDDLEAGEILPKMKRQGSKKLSLRSVGFPAPNTTRVKRGIPNHPD